MMDFALSPEHEDLRSTLRTFFEREAPTAVVAAYDRAERFPQEIYERMAALDLCGVGFGEEYGGSGADELTICIIAEEIARASASLSYAYLPTVTFCARGVADFGSEEQKRAILPRVAAGEMRMSMGLSEPEAGSDLTHLSTRAVTDGDDFVINGQKVFITGADSADLIFTFVRTDPEALAHRGLSVLLVPTDAPGLQINSLPKLAGQATHTCEVFFDDVRVPASNLVGELNHGARIIFRLLDAERIYTAAQSVGIAQGALDQALAYAKERRQFGKPILEHQAVGHMLAEMAIQVRAARLVVYQAAWKLQEGLPCSLEASMAKVLGAETGTQVAIKGMQILGGYSYMVEYGMERYYREAKLYEIAGGTTQIQKNIIVKHLGGFGLPPL
jgi:alkylation response protein AidB-like acyl-CoA dehydrogenase